MRGGAPAGTSVVIARSAEGNVELAGRLHELGLTPIPIETVEFLEPADWSKVDRALVQIDTFDWVLLTSPRGVSSFARRMKELGLERNDRHPRVAGVGERTAESLIKEGFEVDFAPSEYTTAALGRRLPLGLGRKVLLLRAERASHEIVAILERRGFSVTAVTVYRTRFVEERYRGRNVEAAKAVLLGSPSEVEGLRKRLAPPIMDRLKSGAIAMCIGPVTAKSAKEAGFERVAMPKTYTFDALLMEVRRLVAR